MAGYTCRGEIEPLMRLERPSTARSQITAHIINACFNERLSHKPLDFKEINNLAVSKRIDSASSENSEYHDYFVDKLEKLSNECNKRLEELSQVEHHLMEARAKAIAEDEKNLANLVSNCPSYKTIGLPLGPSQFRKHLDEELLARHKLLIPSQYLPSVTLPSTPPKGDPPLFLQPTKSSSHRMRTLPPSEKKSLSSTVPSQKRKCQWQECLRVPDRLAEKNALMYLERRTAFLKNARYSSGLNNTASSGPLKQKMKLTQQEEWTARLFSIEPSEVKFSRYQPGGTYQSTVQFKNISEVARQIRLLPIKSQYFSAAPGQFPTKEGLIAPGMHCTFTVTFTPDSLANYQESMQVIVSSGDCLIVPLVGSRPFPELNLPSVLDCGGCLVGHKKTHRLLCDNSGGEGSFKIMGVNDAGENENGEDFIIVGPFQVSPKEFFLQAGGSVAINVTYTPPSVGEFSEKIYMACDNGQVLSYSLIGTAEVMHIGCIHFRPSSANERDSVSSTTTSLSKACAVKSSSSRTSSDCKDEQVSMNDIIVRPCIEFPPTNPHSPSFLTVLIHNFSNVNVSYTWRYFRPFVKSLSAEEKSEDDNSVLEVPVPSTNSLFTVFPSTGVLLARETSTFVVCFNPIQLGSFVDMGYLTLTDEVNRTGMNSSSEGIEWVQLSDSSISVVCLQMQGICQPYIIELDPPLFIIPHKIDLATEITRTVKVYNHSCSTVHYQWSSYKSSNASITVNPSHGRVLPSVTGYHELIIQGLKEGSFSTTLYCSLNYFPSHFPLHISGKIQGPTVSLDCSNLRFGLIRFGQRHSLKMCVKNESNCPITYKLNQLIQESKDGFSDHRCLSFLPAKGTLKPQNFMSIIIECKPKQPGRLRSILQVLVDGKPNKHISVEAEVQCPGLCLSSSLLHFDEAYVGIPLRSEFLLRNNTLIPAHFTWSSKVFGDNSQFCKVRIEIMTGQVGPQEEILIPLTVTWTAEGSYSNVFLKCNVLDMTDPLIASLTANVRGLSVNYMLEQHDLNCQHQTSVEQDEVPTFSYNDQFLDFGCDNKLGQPTTLNLKVMNTSSIPTSLEAFVMHFPSAQHLTQPNSQRHKYLLRKTSHTDKVYEQQRAEHASNLLEDGRGACFIVEPPTADLPAFSSITLKITAYADMWGEYVDNLICRVKGFEDKIFPMKLGVVGCPVRFQSTATFGNTLIRFGSHVIGTKPVKRCVSMRNSSPIALHVNWRVFNILKNDDKLLDLIAFFDTPFSKKRLMMAKSECSTPMTTESVYVESEHDQDAGINDIKCSSANDSEDLEDSMEELNNGTCSEAGRNSTAKCEDRITMETTEASICSDKSESIGDTDIYCVRLQEHEGEEAYDTFNVHPKRMVIPAHGSAIVEITYVSTKKAFKQMGETPCGYILGHVTIDTQNPPHTTRLSGYDIEALRINVMAGIEESQLLLECDEDEGLHFECCASLLYRDDMKVQSEASQVHDFTLINPSTSTMCFDFSTTSSSFFVANVHTLSNHPLIKNGSLITIKPQGTVRFSVKFSFSQYDILDIYDQNSSRYGYSELLFEGKLQLKYSTYAIQEFPLSAAVKLPMLSLSANSCNMGTCLLGQTSTSSFVISNVSSSIAQWTAVISQELNGVITVSPVSGSLIPHLHEGKPSTQLISVTFSPRSEISYKGSILIKETLTGQEWTYSISGSGSADELYSQ